MLSTTKLAELSVPSKTFLLGEYSVLRGGPALLVSTAPRFSMRVFDSKEKTQNFHPDSPAGLISKNMKYFFEFHDPYARSGGLGASSAQFILVQAFLSGASDWQSFYQKFRELNKKSKTPPSGADVVSQVNGGITYFNGKEASKLKWNFTDLDFSLFKTSEKLATHEHLKEASFERFDLAIAESSVRDAARALAKADSEAFIAAFKEFAGVLDRAAFVAASTKETLKAIYKDEGVLAAKGCGAMGADVICVLHRKKLTSDFGLKYLASSKQIEEVGLKG